MAETRARLIGLAAAIGFMAGTGQWASAQPLANGLDVVLLVDVSRSMFTTDTNPGGMLNPRDRPNGTDPDRIRWDAVQVVLNLLTADDRVLILPFNNEAPASAQDSAGRTLRIPGELPLELLPVGDNRRQLIGRVETFIPFGSVGDSPAAERTDLLGTAILKALRKAAELTKPERVAPGRRLAAILLTDGKEDADQLRAFPGLKENANLRYHLGPWALSSPERPGTPVYTIALGSEQAGLLDLYYLRRMSTLTGGDSISVQRNSQLIATFRDLIWQLKGNWIKPIDLEDRHPIEDTTRGIVDVGILAYSERPEGDLPDHRTNPRNTALLTTKPRFTWKPAGRRVYRRSDHRVGRLVDSLDFWYFGRSTASEGSPFKDLDDNTLTLETEFGPAAAGDRVAFAKSTALPLFEVEPPDLRPLSRYQGLDLRVHMSETRNFDPKQFRATAYLALQGDQSGPGGKPPERWRGAAFRGGMPDRRDARAPPGSTRTRSLGATSPGTTIRSASSSRGSPTPRTP